jgi:hypothetical protein
MHVGSKPATVLAGFIRKEIELKHSVHFPKRGKKREVPVHFVGVV